VIRCEWLNGNKTVSIGNPFSAKISWCALGDMIPTKIGTTKSNSLDLLFRV